jgi:hypothetical protein
LTGKIRCGRRSPHALDSLHLSAGICPITIWSSNSIRDKRINTMMTLT